MLTETNTACMFEVGPRNVKGDTEGTWEEHSTELSFAPAVISHAAAEIELKFKKKCQVKQYQTANN